MRFKHGCHPPIIGRGNCIDQMAVDRIYGTKLAPPCSYRYLGCTRKPPIIHKSEILLPPGQGWCAYEGCSCTDVDAAPAARARENGTSGLLRRCYALAPLFRMQRNYHI